MKALSAAAGEKAVAWASANAGLLELHDLGLPSEFMAGGARRYLDRAMATLKLDALPQRPDLSVADLVERNELMQCVHLHASGADIAPCPVGQLHPGRSPFKNPRGPSYRLVDSDVESTMRHATMRQIDETVGSSWSVASSTKGAVFFGFGVAAWSASMSAAGANETKSSEMGSTSSETTTHVKVKRAILSGAQFSLADRDWELTPEFESSLVMLAARSEAALKGIGELTALQDSLQQDSLQPFIDKSEDAFKNAISQKARVKALSAADLKKAVAWASANAGLLELHDLGLPSELMAGGARRYLDRAMATLKLADGETPLARRLLDEYGSHLATQAVLGGRYKIECHVTTDSTKLKGDQRTAVANALNGHASAAAAGAGFFEAFAGAGEVGVALDLETHNLAQKTLQEKVKTTHSKTMLSVTVTGGAPGDMTAWLNDLRKSNCGWEVVDRSPQRGLIPIWDLVRKSRRLSVGQQEEVSDSIKACFENQFSNDSDDSDGKFGQKPRLLTLLNGCGLQNLQDYAPPTCVVKNGVCYVEGTIKGKVKDEGVWGDCAVLPEQCRPTKRLVFNLGNNGSTCRVDVMSSGVITWEAGGEIYSRPYSWLSLTGIVFRIGDDNQEPLTLRNSCVPYGAREDYAPPTFVVKNGVCYVEGMIEVKERGDCAVLPEKCRPNKRLVFNLNSDGSTCRVDVLSSGVITWEARGKDSMPTFISLTGIVFRIGDDNPEPRLLTLVNGWLPYGKNADYAPPTFVVKNGVCYVEGTIRGEWGDCAVLPEKCRPNKELTFNLNNDDFTCIVDVTSSGVIHMCPGSTTGPSWISLTGIAFSIDN